MINKQVIYLLPSYKHEKQKSLNVAKSQKQLKNLSIVKIFTRNPKIESLADRNWTTNLDDKNTNERKKNYEHTSRH